ncbi:helix-turn-helix transcriptional regulator [Parabacteroides faecis]|uniref:helix-turn-helix transcriptional regulator n=1 Tax=Parabacteroides faecis TaxID=1217282 RepID=UPI003522FC49
MDNILKNKLRERVLWFWGFFGSKRDKVAYISTEEWPYIERWTNYIFDDFLVRLSKHYPNLSHNDLRICCLIKLKVDRLHIASLMGISPPSVSTCKFRIKKKIDAGNVNKILNHMSLESYLLTF